MSQEKVLKALEGLGLAELEAQVYVFLGKRGSQKATDIARAFKIRKQRVYMALKKLEGKGLVNATLEYPSRFSALPFEKALDLFVKAKMEEARRIEGHKDELFSDWQSISIAPGTDHASKFSVIEGRNAIYARLRQMIEEARTQLSIISTVPALTRADRFGLIDTAVEHAAGTKTRFRFLADLSENNMAAMKALLARIPAKSSFEGRTPDLGLKLTSRLVIKDDAEAAFFINRDEDEPQKDTDDTCLWTNSKTIVNSFQTVFEETWRNSTDIAKRIIEIEVGRPSPRTYVMRDPEEGKRKYNEAIAAAREEITILTSSNGLDEILRNEAALGEKVQNGVSVRIMAPITKDNLPSALKLSQSCKVRHVPTSYLDTTVVDRSHLFQFKNAPLTLEGTKASSGFENAFYTNDSEYLERANRVLDSVWENSSIPSPITMDGIAKPPAPDIPAVPDDEFSFSRKNGSAQKNIAGFEEKPRLVTEEYVLNKIINAKRVDPVDSSKHVTFYGSNAYACFRLPAKFDLPDIVLLGHHMNKQSSFGGGDVLQVHVWLETPKGYAFVPSAYYGDNPEIIEWAREPLVGTPAHENCRVVRKDELQILVQGTTMFVGWTIPIPLFPTKCILPPACFLVECYGKVKTSVVTGVLPSGAKLVTKQNGFDGFATFFHPVSKYAGLGSDAAISRDWILTIYPPNAEPKL